MKIKNAEGKEEEIELKKPTGALVKEGFKLYIKIESSNRSIEDVDNYVNFLDTMAAKLSGMNIKELDELENDEKEKIVDYCHSYVKSRVGFMIPSSKQAH